MPRLESSGARGAYILSSRVPSNSGYRIEAFGAEVLEILRSGARVAISSYVDDLRKRNPVSVHRYESKM